jgi:hypothetical protein
MHMRATPNAKRDWTRTYFVAVEVAALELAILFVVDYYRRLDTGPYPIVIPSLYSYGCPALLLLLLFSIIGAWIWKRYYLAVVAPIVFIVTLAILIIGPNFVRA